MALDEAALQALIDKDAIRDLVLLYSRAIDRKDGALLRDLYTEDATDTHGTDFSGTASEFCTFMDSSWPHLRYSGHHACNHLIEVQGDVACGEVYAIAEHCLPDAAKPDAWIEDFLIVRYLDTYRRCEDGKWRFSKRKVVYDMHIKRPFNGDGDLGSSGAIDPSYGELPMRLFARGARG
jgi:ketosteroid isomerase-like protein